MQKVVPCGNCLSIIFFDRCACESKHLQCQLSEIGNEKENVYLKLNFVAHLKFLTIEVNMSEGTYKYRDSFP